MDTLTALCFVWETTPMEHKSLSHTINKPTTLEQQEEAGDRKDMDDKTCCSKLHEEWRGRKNKRGSRRWVAVGWKRHQEQSELRARGEPCQAAWGSHGSLEQRPGQAGKSKPGRRWEERDPDGNQAGREEKPFKDARLNMGLFAKEQWGNKDGLAWTEALREGMQRDLTAQAEQSRRRLGSKGSSPHRNAPLGTEAEIPGSNHSCVWPPSEMCKQKLLLQLRVPPHHVGSSGQERGSKQGTQRIPPDTHVGYTQHHTGSSALKNLFIHNLREFRILQVQAHKAGQFCFGQFLSSLSPLFDHWNDQTLQCTPQTHSAQTWFCHFLTPECLTLYSLNKGLSKVAFCG